MCNITDKLKGIESKPTSNSFKDIEKIPWVINWIWKIIKWHRLITKVKLDEIIKLINTIK